MKRSALLALAPMLVLASPLQAAERPQATASARTNYVYAFAWEACPKARELTSQLHKDALPGLVSAIAKRAQMTNSESDMLMMMCFMYDRGTKERTRPATQ